MGCGASASKTWDGLQQAIQDNDKDKLKGIIDKGWDVNKTGGPNKDTLLLSACAYSMMGADKNRRDICASLIEWKADISKTNEVGSAPLHTASGCGDIALAKLLIDSKADVNQKDTLQGCTPIFSALMTFNKKEKQEKQQGVVELLIAQKADLTVEVSGSNTPAYVAAFNDNAAALNALIQAGAKKEEVPPEKQSLIN